METSLYALLEAELGNFRVTELTLTCASSDKRSSQWTEEFGQARRHLNVACELLHQLGLDPNLDAPSRLPPRANTEALAHTILRAELDSPPHEAQSIAAQCLVEAMTSARCSWELIPVLADRCSPGERAALLTTYRDVDGEKGVQLRRAVRCARELWLRSLGLRVASKRPEPDERARAERHRNDVRPLV